MSEAESPSNASADLASFLTALANRIEAVNPALLRQADDALLDTLGCIVFGVDQPWTKAAHRHALATGGDGRCTVIGADRCTTPAMAAFANGAAAHAFELDDVHEEAINHPGAVVIPAALAVAEHVGASGHDLLEAIVVGYEAMGRAGIAVGPTSHMLSGFHPTSMSGVFGSATAAARLLGFDAEQLNHAFGIAATMASGTMEFVSSGGMTKRIHAARAAEGGVTAAMLVANGLEGPLDGLAGTYGFCQIFTDEPRADLLTEQLGERWMLDEITVKPYAACSDIHPMIQAAAELRTIHRIVPDRIVRIDAEGPTKAATQNDLDGTVSVMAAQYSAQFNIAAALIADPSDPATYDPANLTNPALGALQAKVATVTAAAEFDETYAWKVGGRVRITLDDGSVLERTVIGQKGSMHSPLTPAELDQKFTGLVGAHRARHLAAAIRNLGAADIDSLSSALRQTE